MTLPTAPVASAAAWYGADLADSDSWIRVFSPAEINELEAAAEQARVSGKPRTDLTREDFPLPGLAAACRAWLKELAQGRGFLLLRGLPVQRWGEELSALTTRKMPVQNVRLTGVPPKKRKKMIK